MGDICPSYGHNPEDADALFKHLKALLGASALTVCNLEEPFSGNGTPIKKCGENLRGRAVWLEKFRNMGIGAASLSNNHIMDFGVEALKDTLEYAEKNGIATFGAGMSQEEAAKPFFYDLDGIRVGFVSFAEEEFNCAIDYSAGANFFDVFDSFDDIKRARADCDYLVVLYHGGVEHYKLPSPMLQKKCRKMTECGADLVLCQHSHCIGTVETHGGATILYGQGNSVFSFSPGNEQWNTGLVVHLEFENKSFSGLKFSLIEATAEEIVVAEEEKTEKRIAQMRQDSERLSDPHYLKEQWKKFCDAQASHYYPLLFGWGKLMNKLNRLSDNRLVGALVSDSGKMVAMNLLRCDSHREVCRTLLEDDCLKQ